jgi:CheY-like chemotaxis protein
VRYTVRGGVRVHAERERTGAVYLHIQDTGIGIPAEHLPRIFEPFYQVGNARQDRRKGLGLGLATVRRFADQLKIDVRVSAVPEGGTCFTLRLTRADVPSGPPRAAESAVNGAFAGRRILAVEDDPAIADALLRLLQTWGCDVLSATDGPQALALAEQMAPPDAVIADLALPGGLSGLAVVQRLRERWGDAVPMLFITGSTDGPVYEAAQASGLPLLVKPVAPARLRAFLAQAFSAAPGP